MEKNKQVAQIVIDEAVNLTILAFKKRQKELNLSQYKIAQLSGLPESNISRIWSGASKEITIQTYFRLCFALQINPYLMAKEDDTEDKNYIYLN